METLALQIKMKRRIKMESKNMEKDKKIDLREISVQSFITTLDNDEQNEIKGGTGTQNMGTLVPILC